MAVGLEGLLGVIREFGVSDALGAAPVWHILLSGWLAHIAFGAAMLVLARYLSRRLDRANLVANRLFGLCVVVVAGKELACDLPNANFAALVVLDSTLDTLCTALGGWWLGRYALNPYQPPRAANRAPSVQAAMED